MIVQTLLFYLYCSLTFPSSSISFTYLFYLSSFFCPPIFIFLHPLSSSYPTSPFSHHLYRILFFYHSLPSSRLLFSHSSLFLIISSPLYLILYSISFQSSAIFLISFPFFPLSSPFLSSLSLLHPHPPLLSSLYILPSNSLLSFSVCPPLLSSPLPIFFLPLPPPSLSFHSTSPYST